MTYALFTSFTCSKCFIQVFFDEKGYSMQLVNTPLGSTYILFEPNSTNPNTYIPDADMTPSRVCRDLLTEGECRKWKTCCAAAQDCCLQTQQIQPKSR